MKQEQLEQQAKAWMAVVEALNAACPGWIDGKESAQELAVKAISEMRARIDSLEKDAARLDWMIDEQVFVEYERDNYWLEFPEGSEQKQSHPSAREAIDTAMQSANNGEIHA